MDDHPSKLHREVAMSDPTPPRRPPFGWGKAPPQAAAAPAPPAWELVEEEDAGFEVVEDAPPPSTTARPAGAKVVPSSDPTPAPRPALKALRAEPVEDRDDRPEPAKPKPKKKRRVQPTTVDDDGQAARDQALKEFEWIWPLILLAAGVVLTFVGGFGAAGPIGAFQTLLVMVLGLLVTIPVTIIALMGIGMLVGIEYGRLGPAILKIAAIAFIVNGIYFVGEWMKLPVFIVFPIGCAVSFALFMTQFDLDTWETNASVGAVNVMTFIATMVMVGFLVVAEAATGGGGGGDDDPDLDEDDPVPADVQKDRRPGRDRGPGNPQPPLPDDDDDGDDWDDDKDW
jgi:hypothetical protein